MNRRRSRYLVVIGTMLVCAAPLRADVVRQLGRGLGLAGFNIQGQNNPLSGGVDILVNRILQGNTLDFGAWDLTLQGPVSFDLSTGGRALSQLDVGISTALNSNAAAQPLSYILNYDVGGQQTQISGTLLMDADFSVNGFGFYDFSATYSSRQTVDNSGRFADGATPFDFDVGPINVSGNIFADALALITQPLFDATNSFNPFLSFSGSDSLSGLLAGSPQTLQKQLSLAADVLASQQQAYLAATPISGLIGGVSDQLGPVRLAATASGHRASAVVPEPTVLLLLLLGAPLVARLPLRARRLRRTAKR